ncbi:TrmB family transcriptional regulator [Oceanivirga miroungae]|uniref:TrmB family transcriptional regulator n=1 Tax=Oceanivirga miroungae TaxID=1130046 RepID=UPI0012E7162F|nr:helix-turn-helix domain-containing protein [Oceanivirga miroungae]
MELVEKLKKVGFSDSMALVYIELLKNPGYNGTQIFKELDLPRSSVYKALEDLLELEYITLIPSSENLKNYVPKDPKILTKEIKIVYENVLQTLGLELEMIYRPQEFNEVYNISGLNNFYYKLNEMMEKATKKIVVSGKIDNSKIQAKTELEIISKNILDENEVYILIDDSEILVARLNDNYAVGIYTKNSIIIKKYEKEN